MKTSKRDEANTIRAIHLTDHRFVSRLMGKYSWSIYNGAPRSTMQFRQEQQHAGIHVTKVSPRIEIKQYIQPLHIQLIYRSAQLVALAQAKAQAFSSLLRQAQAVQLTTGAESGASSYRGSEPHHRKLNMSEASRQQGQQRSDERSASGKRYIAARQQNQLAPYSANYPLMHRLEQERVASWEKRSAQQLLETVSRRELVLELEALQRQDQRSQDRHPTDTTAGHNQGSNSNRNRTADSRTTDHTAQRASADTSGNSRDNNEGRAEGSTSGVQARDEQAQARDEQVRVRDAQAQARDEQTQTRHEQAQARGEQAQARREQTPREQVATVQVAWSQTVQRVLAESSNRSSNASVLSEAENATQKELLQAVKAASDLKLNPAAVAQGINVIRKKAILQQRSIVHEQVQANNKVIQHQQLHTTISGRQLLRKFQAALLQSSQQLVIKQQSNGPLQLSYRIVQDRNSVHERKVSQVYRSSHLNTSPAIMHRTNKSGEVQPTTVVQKAQSSGEIAQLRHNVQNADDQTASVQHAQDRAANNRVTSEPVSNQAVSNSRTVKDQQADNQAVKDQQVHDQAASQYIVSDKNPALPSQSRYRVRTQALTNHELQQHSVEQSPVLTERSGWRGLIQPLIRTSIQQIVKLRNLHMQLNGQGEKVVSVWSRLDKHTATQTMNIQLVHRKLSEQEQRQSVKRSPQQSENQLEHREQIQQAEKKVKQQIREQVKEQAQQSTTAKRAIIVAPFIYADNYAARRDTKQVAEQASKQVAEDVSKQATEQVSKLVSKQALEQATKDVSKQISGRAFKQEPEQDQAAFQLKQAVYKLQRDERLSYYFVSSRTLIERIQQQYYSAKQAQHSFAYSRQPDKLQLSGINRSITILNIEPVRLALRLSQPEGKWAKQQIEKAGAESQSRSDKQIAETKLIKQLEHSKRLVLIQRTESQKLSARSPYSAQEQVARPTAAIPQQTEQKGKPLKLYLRPVVFQLVDNASSGGKNKQARASLTEQLTRRYMLRTRLLQTQAQPVRFSDFSTPVATMLHTGIMRQLSTVRQQGSRVLSGNEREAASAAAHQLDGKELAAHQRAREAAKLVQEPATKQALAPATLEHIKGKDAVSAQASPNRTGTNGQAGMQTGAMVSQLKPIGSLNRFAEWIGQRTAASQALLLSRTSAASQALTLSRTTTASQALVLSQASAASRALAARRAKASPASDALSGRTGTAASPFAASRAHATLDKTGLTASKNKLLHNELIINVNKTAQALTQSGIASDRAARASSNESAASREQLGSSSQLRHHRGRSPFAATTAARGMSTTLQHIGIIAGASTMTRALHQSGRAANTANITTVANRANTANTTNTAGMTGAGSVNSTLPSLFNKEQRAADSRRVPQPQQTNIAVNERSFPAARLDVKKEAAPQVEPQGVQQLQQTVQRLEQQLKEQQQVLVKQDTRASTRQLVDQLYDELSRKLRMEAKRLGR